MRLNPTANSPMTRWRRKNKVKAKEYNKKYYREHREYMIRKDLKWKKENPKKFKTFAKESHLRSIGWSIKARKEAAKKQRNKCAICGKKNNQKNRPLHSDHDHKTKKKRELLCSGCNTGLGAFRDSRVLLLNAAKYLKRHGR